MPKSKMRMSHIHNYNICMHTLLLVLKIEDSRFASQDFVMACLICTGSSLNLDAVRPA